MAATLSRPATAPVVPNTATGTVRPSRYTVGLLTVLGAVFLVALAPRLDTDLWWHLKDGATIAATHRVPTRDSLSFTFAGRAWTDHEWLSDLFLYGCYRLAGLWGTIVAFALVILATFALVHVRMARAARTGTDRLLGLFVLAGAFVASSATWGARPQMLTLLFLALYALILDRWKASRNRRLLALFPAVMLLWANLHGGWVLGLGLMTLTLAGEWLNRATRHPEALTGTDLRDLAATIGLTLAATLVNPAGWHEVVYPLVWIFPTAYSNVLTEWVSSDFHQPVTMVFEGLLLTLFAAVFVGRPRLNWTHLFLTLAFTHLALSQARNVAVWSVLITPLVALYLQEALRRRPANSGERTRRGGFPVRTESLINAALLLATVLLYLTETFHFVNAAALRRNETATFPSGAVGYMKHHRLPSRTLTSYAWGGYLLWRGAPRYQDFIDGRANTLFDTGLLRAYLTVYSAAPGWHAILQQYRVGNVLIEPTAPLAQVLARETGWRRVYSDGTAVLYTRR